MTTSVIEKHSAFRLNRLLSVPLSSFLLRTLITPNQITLLSLTLGILAGLAFSRGTYLSGLVGALCYQVAIVLDNCDGEIARAKNMRSALGAWLDIVADFFTDVSLFLGIGFGVLAARPDQPVLLFMFLCLSGGVLHLALVIWEKLRGFGPAVFHSADATNQPAKISWILNTFDALREGEASWFVVAFAVTGKVEWLLWFGGIYMQILWISGAFMDCRRLLTPARKS